MIEFSWENKEEANTLPDLPLLKPISSLPMTKLVKLIAKRDWVATSVRLMDPNFRHETQRLTMLPPCGQLDDMIGLPLHLACTMRPLPPASLVERLIETYPEGARR